MTSSEKNDGGPAFPYLTASVADHEVTTHEGEHGMTLRFYLAAKAMQGLLANPGGPVQSNGRSGWDLVNCQPCDVAGLAFGIADAMLEAGRS